MKLEVVFVSPGLFNWASFAANGSQIANGTGTSVQNAGAQAVQSIRQFCNSQAASFTALSTNWQ